MTPSEPSVTQVCAFIEYLGTYLKSPASITNYVHVSAVRSYLRDRNIPHSAFNSHRVATALDAFARSKQHKVSQMLPLSEKEVHDIVKRAWRVYNAPHLVLPLLIMYYTDFRLSEVAPYTAASYCGAPAYQELVFSVKYVYAYCFYFWAR